MGLRGRCLSFASWRLSKSLEISYRYQRCFEFSRCWATEYSRVLFDGSELHLQCSDERCELIAYHLSSVHSLRCFVLVA